MANDYGNVPGQPVYGEVQQMEAQEAGAPLATEEATPMAEAAPAPVAPEEVPPAAPTAPSPNNIVDVLPPASTAPAVTGQRPLRPEQQLAFIILGTPGMSSITRGFAAQIMGQYRAESGLPEQNLSPADLAAYRQSKIQETLPVVEEPTGE